MFLHYWEQSQNPLSALAVAFASFLNAAVCCLDFLLSPKMFLSTMLLLFFFSTARYQTFNKATLVCVCGSSSRSHWSSK